MAASIRACSACRERCAIQSTPPYRVQLRPVRRRIEPAGQQALSGFVPIACPADGNVRVAAEVQMLCASAIPGTTEAHRLFTQLIREAQRRDEVDAGVDAERLATHLQIAINEIGRAHV